MSSHFYSPPPMPQGTVPPRRYVPTSGQSGNADVVLTTTARIYLVRNLYELDRIAKDEIFYRPRPATIVGKIPDQSGAGDTPPRSRIYLPLEHYRWLTAPPVQDYRKLSPSLFNPEPSIPSLFLPSRQMYAHIVRIHHDVDTVSPAIRINRARRFVRFELPFIPPGRIVAFQPNAFQSTYPGELYAFQSQNRFVTLSLLGQSTLGVRELIHIVIGPLMDEYRKGTAIVLTAKTYDPAQVPSVLFNPDGGVLLTLVDPTGLEVLDDEPMGRIATGDFRTIYQTTDLSEAGVYLISARSENAGHISLTIPVQAFRLVE